MYAQVGVREAEEAARLARARADEQGRVPGSHAEAAAEAEEMRLRLARGLETEAHAAHERGERRRERRASLRSMLVKSSAGPAPAAPTQVPVQLAPLAPPWLLAREIASVRAATQAYLDGLGPHNAGEDMHPHRLDTAESELESAMADAELAKRAAFRDARDAI